MSKSRVLIIDDEMIIHNTMRKALKNSDLDLSFATNGKEALKIMETSIPSFRIVEDIRRLIDNGTKEVTLLGQNVNSYRDGKTDFPDLLIKIHELSGLDRIRFTTSHPRDCTDKLIRTMANSPKLCRHLQKAVL